METSEHVSETIFKMGFIRGAITREDVVEWFKERGVTVHDMVRLKSALEPFLIATYADPKGATL